ncbi:MAG: response regulator [Hyphomonadaceae bacterium]|nr:response regulator [Hyphomonadaceae bacterium]MBP9235014.1 response regulator [Hyphomonadaceae bacterium]
MTEERTLNPADLKKMKVLVVDPNAFMRGVVADSLRRLMVTNIMAAASAVEAFTVGRAFKPDVIFVDWDAGRMSGLEFTREVRRNTTGVSRETPIILLAGVIDHDQLMSARQAGINEFLLKPVSAQGVLSRIEEVVLRPRKFIDSRNYVGPCRRRKDDPNYAGPWRRLTDEPPQKATSEMAKENAFKLRAIIESLAQYADRTNDDRTAGIRGMYRMLQQNADEVARLGDEVIVKVWSTALRYIEGVGMTDTYDIEVVKYHFQTIAIILDMPEEAFLHRASVSNELERLVNKKIHSAHEKKHDVA